jgi:hypothetical protein
VSAETLRRAAALMRERADANLITPSPWGFAGVSGQGFAVHHGEHDTVALYANRPDADHIASWHPAVALAVADWLECVAEVHWPKRSDLYTESHYNAEPEHDYFDPCDESCFREAYICNGCGTRECKPEISGAALAVARAYLGESE